MAHKVGVTGYLLVVSVVDGLACLALYGWVKNQVVWGLACLVTYVLVISYNIVVFVFFVFMYI